MDKVELFCSQSEDALTAMLRDGPRAIGIAEASFHPWTGMWWVARVYVQPTYRCLGYGTQLMQALLLMLDKDGRAASLVPNPYDETINFDRLARFYARHGFLVNEEGIMLRSSGRVSDVEVGSDRGAFA